MGTEEENTLSNLPQDVLQAILSRLPVKSILRFRSVSKSWNKMISDPSFLRMHLQLQHSSHNLFLHNSSNPSNYRTGHISWVKFTKENGQFQHQSRLECPRPGWHDVCCVCEGVVLVTDHSCNTFMLWNPSTRKETMFWFPYKFENWPFKQGLCHDPTTGDFKVVLTSDKYYTVFSCKNNSWAGKRAFQYYSCRRDTDAGIFIDGVIYWVVMDRARNTREIIYFDPRDDDFKILEKPENIKDELFYVVCLRGCLSLYYHTRSDKTAVQIWVKEKGRDRNTWNKLMMIENEEPAEWFRPMCLFENNNILLRLEQWGRFVIYSPGEKTFEECGDINDPSLQVKLFPCGESLLFPLQNLRRPKRKNMRDTY
ncbi:putative F-box protein at1g47790 [Phtheirospermum japonicum]|uniref:Putative F-box protein at1g47790 n=1 Tax=Phtheirospermum japonicum TaxID=374723 RepID=A0A830BLZ8_9LAMI|nr:putative F-box protein at1g47790 [Phtheirospermum japonicum]